MELKNKEVHENLQKIKKEYEENINSINDTHKSNIKKINNSYYSNIIRNKKNNRRRLLKFLRQNTLKMYNILTSLKNESDTEINKTADLKVRIDELEKEKLKLEAIAFLNIRWILKRIKSGF